MKTTLSLIILIVLLSSVKSFSQFNSTKVPKEWDKTFVISVSHTGSMSGATSHFTFTYDSCKYELNSLREKSEKKSFLLSPKDRELILSKLRELKVENIKSELHLGTQHDGWSTMLCLGGHCIEGGSASEMNDKSRAIFVDACQFLEDFAREKN